MFTVFFFARLSLRPGFEEMVGLFGLFQRITVTIGWAWLTLLAVYMLKDPSDIHQREESSIRRWRAN
jgi:hypothetical protein